MKTILLLPVILCFLYLNAFASPADTTFKTVLNEGENPVSISVVVKQYPYADLTNDDRYGSSVSVFTITIDGKSMSDSLPYEESFRVEIVDINSKDKSKEILISSGGSPDYCYWVYKYSNGLVQIAKTDFLQEFIPDGSGVVLGVKWMGFCIVKDTYKLSKDGNSLEKVPIDFYPIKYTFDEGRVIKDYEVKAVKSFKIYKDRKSNCKVKSEIIKDYIQYTVTGYDDNSVLTEIKKGEKVILTGYDTKYTTIKNSQGEESWWVWIQMKSASGKTGWIFMSAYDQEYWNEYFEGVHFAG
ncbi:MAG: hypothetical protein ACOYN6_03340 [Ignavibacteria bacterium]